MKKGLIYFIIGVVLAIILMHKCSPGPKTVTKIEYKTKIEPITQTLIDSLYKLRPVIKKPGRVVYLKPDEVIKYKDSIVYVKDTTETVILAKEYDATVESDSAKADLKILTTGELLDVTGTITYNQKQTTITKYINASSLFAVVQSDPQFNEIGAGVDYVIKNKFIIGANANYDRLIKEPNIKFKVGLKIF